MSGNGVHENEWGVITPEEVPEFSKCKVCKFYREFNGGEDCKNIYYCKELDEEMFEDDVEEELLNDEACQLFELR
jgi:hypothetical protein